MLKPNLPVAIFMEGALGADIGKMGYGVLRYSPNPVVCVLDSSHSGKTVQDVVSSPRNCPVVANIDDAIKLGAKALILGIAPPGGRIPDDWNEQIEKAVQGGLSIVNGLHEPLSPRFPNLMRDQFVWDLRQEPAGLNTGTGAARLLKNRRVLMVGTDMAVGKMTAGLELLREAREAGIDANFIATGQIGITITGSGVPLDAVRVDYASGSIEREVLANQDSELIIIEGQGSLVHPGSTATLPLMRGSMPTDLILCMRAGQTHLRRLPEIEIPPIPTLMAQYESLATVAGTFPDAQVIGIAVNTSDLSNEAARREIADLTSLTGVAVTDPVRYGCANWLQSLKK